MLASQQVLLTDLAWHEGMTEWKALGELTQGKLFYQPQMSQTQAYELPSAEIHHNDVIKHVQVNNKAIITPPK